MVKNLNTYKLDFHISDMPTKIDWYVQNKGGSLVGYCLENGTSVLESLYDKYIIRQFFTQLLKDGENKLPFTVDFYYDEDGLIIEEINEAPRGTTIIGTLDGLCPFMKEYKRSTPIKENMTKIALRHAIVQNLTMWEPQYMQQPPKLYLEFRRLTKIDRYENNLEKLMEIMRLTLGRKKLEDLQEIYVKITEPEKKVYMEYLMKRHESPRHFP